MRCFRELPAWRYPTSVGCTGKQFFRKFADAAFSSLNRRKISLYRTGSANTFCQGPVAAGVARPTQGNDKFAAGRAPRAAGTGPKSTSLQGKDEGSHNRSGPVRAAGRGDRPDLRPMARLPEHGLGLTLPPETAPPWCRDRLSCRLGQPAQLQSRRASPAMLHRGTAVADLGAVAAAAVGCDGDDDDTPVAMAVVINCVSGPVSVDVPVGAKSTGIRRLGRCKQEDQRGGQDKAHIEKARLAWRQAFPGQDGAEATPKRRRCARGGIRRRPSRWASRCL